jgi:tripartite-type tricarboxylate transporter receptor subunit TctC
MKKLFAAYVISAVGFISAVNTQGFPNKMIRIIVPFTPGGSNDVVAREIASLDFHGSRFP